MTGQSDKNSSVWTESILSILEKWILFCCVVCTKKQKKKKNKQTIIALPPDSFFVLVNTKRVMPRINFVYFCVSLCLLFVVTDANFLSLLPKKNDPTPSFTEQLSTLFNPFQQFEDFGKGIEELAQEHAIHLQRSVESFRKKKSTVAANRKSILSNYPSSNDNNDGVKTKRGVEEQVGMILL